VSIPNKDPSSIRLSGCATLILSLALLAAGCKPPLPPSKPLADLTPQEGSGYQVYRAACSGCHFANSENNLRGPGLQGLYKKQYLPSGAPANDDRVIATIRGGRNMMPAFGDKLDDEQTQDLIAYLHTL
jgi:mono/diheme cytochrome c family protein